MCSNPCGSEVARFRPESNRGPYGLLNFLCAVLDTVKSVVTANLRQLVGANHTRLHSENGRSGQKEKLLLQ